MEISHFLPQDEVRRVCAELNLRDWTLLDQPEISVQEAETILRQLSPGILVDLNEFRLGLQIELKHGLSAGANNVTNNHPLLTGMIVLANLAYHPRYYQHLHLLAAEEDLLSAIGRGDPAQINDLYSELVVTSKELVTTRRMNFE